MDILPDGNLYLREKISFTDRDDYQGIPVL